MIGLEIPAREPAFHGFFFKVSQMNYRNIHTFFLFFFFFYIKAKLAIKISLILAMFLHMHVHGRVYLTVIVNLSTEKRIQI